MMYRSTPALMPKSELSKERNNPKPDQQWLQRMIGETKPANQEFPVEVNAIKASTPLQDPLHGKQKRLFAVSNKAWVLIMKIIVPALH